MAFPHLEGRPGYHVSRLGPGRILTIGAASSENGAALAVGRYEFRVTVGALHVRGVHAAGVAAVATDVLREAGDVFYLDVGTLAAEQFISMIRDGAADATVYVAGTSGAAVDAQPSAWA